MSDDGFLVSFLEELTGFQVVENPNHKMPWFKIYEKHRNKDDGKAPFSIIRFPEYDYGHRYDDEEYMVVTLGGKS